MVIVITMVLSAVVIFGGLALLVVTLVRRRAEPSGAFAGAPLATATIISRENTHRAIHYAYRWILTLDVTTPDGQRYTTTAPVRIVAGSEGSTLLPGTVVPVRYRAERPGEVEVAFDQIPGGSTPPQRARKA